MGAETQDVKLLCYWCHDGGVIHSNRRMASLADLKGQRLRFPTRLAGEALKAAGAAPIGMPVTQWPRASRSESSMAQWFRGRSRRPSSCPISCAITC